MRPLCLLLAGVLLAGADLPAAEARRPDLAPGREGKPEKMAPFNVQESVFPSIEVHFELSGVNLATPLADQILEARVTAVDSDGMGSRLGLRVGDVLVSLNGTALRGLTIRQLAALVADARNRQASLVWETRRGITPLTVRYNGKWDTPLPGLTR